MSLIHESQSLLKSSYPLYFHNAVEITERLTITLLPVLSILLTQSSNYSFYFLSAMVFCIRCNTYTHEEACIGLLLEKYYNLNTADFCSSNFIICLLHLTSKSHNKQNWESATCCLLRFVDKNKRENLFRVDFTYIIYTLYMFYR